MTPYEFLTEVLPAAGVCCVSYKDPNVRGMNNRPFLNRQEAADFAVRIASSYDVYFACSAFKDISPFHRRAADALAQQAFWLDVDCGENKPYPTVDDGIRAVGDFVKKASIPAPSVMVNSGYGLHLYWLLTVPLATADWHDEAKALRDLCNRIGLVADHHRTCDAASVLRLPGTVNHKHGGNVPVTVLYATDERYDPGIFLKKPPAVPAQELDALAANFSGETFTKAGPPRGWEDMVLNCAQIREMGSGSYPEWMLAARTVLCTTGGPSMVHALSMRCPEKYQRDTCDTLINSLQNTAVGPGLCETFRSYRPELCESCPFKGKINTPWKLAGAPRPGQISIPALSVATADLASGPIPVTETGDVVHVIPFRSEDGLFQVVPGEGIMYTVKDEDGVPHSSNILPIEVYIHTLCVDNTQRQMPKRTYIMRKVARGMAPVDIPFTLEDALGTNKMELWLGECGMHPAPRWKKQVHAFMNTYIAAMQNALPVVYTRNHFGWDVYNDPDTGQKQTAFVLGHKMFTPGGSHPVRLDERSEGIAAKLISRGSLDNWKQVPRLYRELNQSFAQLLMCAAFGAPLMCHGVGTATNVAYSFWDVEGGKGKSSLLRAMASVWGDPSQMLMGRTDTHAARFQQYAVYRNLPVMVDEITGMHDDDLAAILYDIVNGREKSRSTASGTGLTSSGQWSTITTFTSNQSVYEHLRDFRSQTSATCMRVIEVACDFEDYSGRPEAAVINNAMVAARENFGLAGPVFIEYLLQHTEIIGLIAQAAEKFFLRHSKSADERFWLYGIAMPLYAGALAKDLGLIDYDMAALESWCVSTLLPSLRSRVKQAKPAGTDLLASFINDMVDSMLIVQTASRDEFDARAPQRVAALTGQTLDAYIVQLPKRNLSLRYELDTGRVYASVTSLRGWCKARGLSLDTLLADAEAHGRMPRGRAPVRYALARGIVQLPQTRNTVYCFKVEKKNE